QPMHTVQECGSISACCCCCLSTLRFASSFWTNHTIYRNEAHDSILLNITFFYFHYSTKYYNFVEQIQIFIRFSRKFNTTDFKRRLLVSVGHLVRFTIFVYTAYRFSNLPRMACRSKRACIWIIGLFILGDSKLKDVDAQIGVDFYIEDGFLLLPEDTMIFYFHLEG
ncbi:hypothetical protein ACJX0J_025109, partial [Zea mays]